MDNLQEVLNQQVNFVSTNPILSITTVAGIIAAAGLIIWLIWYQLTRETPLRDRTVLLILAVAFGLMMLNFFFPGDFVRGDGPLHIARTWLMRDILQSGELPIWSNRYYFGHPLEMFFGFNTYLSIIGVSTISGLDLFASTKVVLWFAQVVSGLLMYVYVRRRLHSTIAIFVALAYIITWQHFGVVRRFGVLPLALIYLLIPLLFLLLENFLQKRLNGWWASVGGGALCALAVLTHIQYGTYLSATYFFIVLWIALVYLFYRDWDNVRRFALLGMGTGIVAGLLGGWFIIPSAIERAYLPSIPSVITSLSFDGLIELTLNITLVTRLFTSWGQGYVGWTIILPALIGLVVVSYRLVAHKIISRGMLVGAYPFLVAAVGFILLDPIKRYTGIWLFFVCIVAGYGLKWAIEHFAHSPKSALRWQQAVVILMFLELGPALLLVGDFLNLDAAHATVAHLQQQVEASGIPARIQVFKPDDSIFIRATDTMFTDASIPSGGAVEGAPQTYNIMAAIDNQIATEVYDRGGTPSPTLFDLLRLMNVRYVLMNYHDYFQVPLASPLIFAPAVRVTDLQDSNGPMGHSASDLYENRAIRTDFVDGVVSEMGLDPQQPQADAIILKQPIDNANAGDGACLERQPFQFENVVEKHTSLSFTYNTCTAGYIRLAYSYYPLMQLTVDGVSIPFYPDATSMVVFQALPGEHHVTLMAVVSPLRQILFTVAVITVFILILAVGVQIASVYHAKTLPDFQAQPSQGD